MSQEVQVREPKIVTLPGGGPMMVPITEITDITDISDRDAIYDTLSQAFYRVHHVGRNDIGEIVVYISDDDHRDLDNVLYVRDPAVRMIALWGQLSMAERFQITRAFLEVGHYTPGSDVVYAHPERNHRAFSICMACTSEDGADKEAYLEACVGRGSVREASRAFQADPTGIIAMTSDIEHILGGKR